MILTKRPSKWINTWISKDYCRNWGLHEGLRELICSHYDGICDHLQKENVGIDKSDNKTDYLFFDNRNNKDIYGAINYIKDKKTLMIWNKGNLETANLLLGGTKDIQNSPEIIGRFGEGMKLAALSLIRENTKRNTKDNETQLNIYTCKKLWRFKIDRAIGFTRNGIEQLCLHWCCEDYEKDEYEGNVVCEIIGISEDEWKIEQDNYLWLTHRKIGSIKVYDDNNKLVGEILCEKFFLRKIYVKEVFINDTKDARDMTSYFGFNLDIDLDRDRNSVKDLSTRNKEISKILSIVLNKLDNYTTEQDVDKIWIDKYPEEIYKLLSEGYNLVYYFNEYNHTQQACDEIYKIWEKKHGKIFPAYYNMEKQITDFQRIHRLPKEFYPYSIAVNWLMNPVLIKSKFYKSIEKKFQEELNSKENITPDVNHEYAMNEIIEKIKKVKKDMTRDKIIFKKFDRTFDDIFYNDNGKIVLPSIVLSENIDRKWKCKICGKILDAYEIKISEIIDIFNIF